MRGVYQLMLNNLCYVGSTVRSFKRRWSTHLNDLRKGKHHSVRLQRAYNKYGEDSLTFIVLENVETAEECIPCEQRWIDKLKPEYNACPLAGSCLGIVRTEEMRKKVSETLRGHIVTEETREKIGISHIGKKLTENHKRNLSKALKDHIVSEETRQKIGAKQLGRTHSKEAREKMRIAHAGTKLSEEHKRKIGNASKGRAVSDEKKLMMKLFMKGNRYSAGRVLSEEHKRKISESQKGKTLSEEHKQKLSVSHKAFGKRPRKNKETDNG